MTWYHHSGTGVKFYGDPGAGRGGRLQLFLDGKTTEVVLNSTSLRVETSLIFGAEGMADDDHQLVGFVGGLPERGRVAVAHFECVRCLIPFCLKSTRLRVSALPGLRIRLEGGSTFSLRGQMQRTYPHKLWLWTILARRLYSKMPPSGL